MIGIAIGDAVFLQLSGPSKKPVLHPAKLLDANGDSCTVIVDVPGLTIEEGADFLVYFEKNREFMKQSARVDTVELDAAEDAESVPTVSFTTAGEPVSAERRETYRVSTIMMDLKADVGNEHACSILDVSATGFSIVSTVSYQKTNTTTATIRVDDKTYTGRVSVQSIRELDGGRFRYGLQGIDVEASRTALSNGLLRMSVQTQREQLRRLSGVS